MLGGCVELPDFPVGYDKEVAVSEPNETGIEQWDYVDVDVHKQTAVVAVPDLNSMLCGRRNAIAQRRILRCGYCKLVASQKLSNLNMTLCSHVWSYKMCNQYMLCATQGWEYMTIPINSKLIQGHLRSGIPGLFHMNRLLAFGSLH